MAAEPEDAHEDLHSGLAVRRADGQQVPLLEYLLSEIQPESERVLATEVVLEVPDRRRTSVFLGATPIRSKGARSSPCV